MASAVFARQLPNHSLSTRENPDATATQIRPVVSFGSDQEGSRCDSSKNSYENQACRWLTKTAKTRAVVSRFCF